jgi:hypothetical protein
MLVAERRFRCSAKDGDECCNHIWKLCAARSLKSDTKGVHVKRESRRGSARGERGGGREKGEGVFLTTISTFGGLSTILYVK